MLTRSQPARQNRATKKMPPKSPALAAFLRRAHLQLFSAAAHTLPPSSSLPLPGTQTPPPPAAHFMTQYLISHCGFSPSDAAKKSHHYSHLTSASNPDAVLAFLRALGLDPAAIRRVVFILPNVLMASVSKTLEPKIASLRAAGFSDAEITMLVAGSPTSLICNIAPKLQLLGAYLPSKADLFKALRRDTSLLTKNLAGTLVPNAALLRAHGAAAEDVARVLLQRSRLLPSAPPAFKELFDRAVAHGFRPGTGMFLDALYALSGCSNSVFRGKVELFESLGWSEAEFNAAFLKAPIFARLSNEALRAKMRFLVEEAGLEPRCVAEHPLLLTFSLEQRLVPRLRVRRILKAEGFCGAKSTLYSIFKLPEKRFLELCVLPHLDRVPALGEIYPTA